MNISKTPCVVAFALFLCTLAAPPRAGAGILWTEPGYGELADLNRYSLADPVQRGSFTELGALASGTSVITGVSSRTTVGSVTTIDGDAIRIVIPASMTLESIMFTHSQPLGIREFFRLSTGGAGPYYMSRAYPPSAIPAGTQDLIGLLAPADGLSAGSYVLSWENEGGANTNMSYTINLVAIPAPGAAAALTAGVLVLSVRRRSRHR